LSVLKSYFSGRKNAKIRQTKKTLGRPLPAGPNGILDHQAQLDPRWNG
jgi:hypothetical protein